MITILTDGFPVEVQTGTVILTMVISLIVAVGFYLLRSIGLYKLAKNQAVKGAFMAWIPCVWIFVACKIIKESKVFGFTLDKLAIWFTIIFSITQVLAFAYEFMFYFPLVGNYLAGKEIFILASVNEIAIPTGLSEYLFGGDYLVFIDDTFVYPYKDIFAAKTIAELISYTMVIFDLFYIVIEFVVLFNLFKTYWPERFILAFVLSIFLGLEGIMIFIIRNKKPVNFAEYSRRYTNYQYRDPYQSNRRDYHDNYDNMRGGYNRPPNDQPFNDYDNSSSSNQSNKGEPFSDYMDKGDK